MIMIALLIESLRITTTYLIAVYDLDHLLDLDCLADRGSPGVENTKLITITYLIAGHDLYRLLARDSLADRISPGVVHTHLIAIALDHQHNRPLDNNIISITRTLCPSYFNPMSQVPSSPI